jgi:polar amino acid transport system substrate-binding protein
MACWIASGSWRARSFFSAYNDQQPRIPPTSRQTNKMPKRIATLACVVLFACALAACDEKRNPNSPSDIDALIASGHPEWPPIMYQNGAAIDGAGPALVKKILDDLGVRVVFSYTGTWDQVQAKARTGEVDVLVAAYKTAEREGYMVYSDPYTTDPVAIFVATGRAFPFDSWDVLVGKRGVAMVGDSYGQQFDDFAAARLRVTRVTTTAQAFDLVSSGQADYLLYSLYAGDDYLKKTGTGSQFESLPKFVNEENFYITISKASPFVSYLPRLNQELAKYKANGTVAALIAQYKK